MYDYLLLIQIEVYSFLLVQVYYLMLKNVYGFKMGIYNVKYFEVYMFQEDFDMMRYLVFFYLVKEMGGNLFGLWSDN